MRKLKLVEWIAVVVAFGIAALIFFPSWFSKGSPAVKGDATATLPEGGDTTDSVTTNQNTTPKMANISTTAGLEIYQLVQGTGAEAQAGKDVAVHYVGALTDGTKFDSSLDRGEPIVFTLGTGQVIPGWEKGILGMKVGERRQLVISPDLAYGAAGAGGVIPPNATLIFQVELMGVK